MDPVDTDALRAEGAERMWPDSGAKDIDDVLKAAIQRCGPALDRKLQEVTRSGTTPWQVEGDADGAVQALAALIGAASEDTPVGAEILVTLSAPDRTATVSSVVAGAAWGSPKVLAVGGAAL